MKFHCILKQALILKESHFPLLLSRSHFLKLISSHYSQTILLFFDWFLALFGGVVLFKKTCFERGCPSCPFIFSLTLTFQLLPFDESDTCRDVLSLKLNDKYSQKFFRIYFIFLNNYDLIIMVGFHSVFPILFDNT